MVTPRRLAAQGLLAFVLTLFAGAVAQDVELTSRAFDIARNLRCPVCVSESVADSSAQISQQMRDLIQEKLDEGMTDQQVYAFFQARYGDWILLDPPKRGVHLLIWLLPVFVALVAVAVVAVLARRWLAASRTPIEADPAELERVRELLAAAGQEAAGSGDPFPGSGRDRAGVDDSGSGLT